MNWGMDQGQGHAQPLMMLDDGGMMLDAGWTLTLCHYAAINPGLWWPMMAYDGLWWPMGTCKSDNWPLGHMATLLWTCNIVQQGYGNKGAVVCYCISSPRTASYCKGRLTTRSPSGPSKSILHIRIIYIYIYICIYILFIYIYILASLWQKQSPLLGQHANVYIYPSVTVHPSHMSSWTVKAMRTYMPH